MWILVILVFLLAVPGSAFRSVHKPSTHNIRSMSLTADPVVTAGKQRNSPASWPKFAGVCASIPLFSVTVVPLSITWQLFHFLYRKVVPRSLPPPLDSGISIDNPVEKQNRKYDVVVLGATGFTGKLAVRHLLQQDYKEVLWAVAGRSESKLRKTLLDVGEELGVATDHVPIVVADTSIPSTLSGLVRDTRVLATTVGPYVNYGSTVVEACAKGGTDYVDITGEVDWVKAMVDQWDVVARKTGARIVPLCGHDSIPWDLLVQKMQDELGDEDLAEVQIWDEAKGFAPGGTFATIIASVVEGVVATTKNVEAAFGPSIVERDLPTSIAKSTSRKHDRQWTMPFIMAVVNADVVDWTVIQRQGTKLKYWEALVTPDFKTAFTMFAGMIMSGIMMLNPLTLTLLRKTVIPPPGSGAPLQNLLKGFLYIDAVGTGVQGTKVEASWFMSNDAGCVETTKMLVESALCLAKNEASIKEGGFGTPAYVLGDGVLDRLRKVGTIFTCKKIH